MDKCVSNVCNFILMCRPMRMRTTLSRYVSRS